MCVRRFDQLIGYFRPIMDSRKALRLHDALDGLEPDEDEPGTIAITSAPLHRFDFLHRRETAPKRGQLLRIRAGGDALREPGRLFFGR